MESDKRTSQAQFGRGLHHLVVVFGEALVHPFVVPHDGRYAQRRAVVTRNFSPTRGSLSHRKTVLRPRNHRMRLTGDGTLKLRIFPQIHGHLEPTEKTHVYMYVCTVTLRYGFV